MISCMIGAMKVQDVTTDDIPGAFLKTDYNKVDILINMYRVILTMLKEIDLV